MTHETRTGFAHERLDAYHLAQELAVGAVEAVRRLPRGFADLRDQVTRSALATVRHIAEGANRETHADKRARFVIARGECAECAASLETAGRLGRLPAGRLRHLLNLADRIGAMLTGLIRRHAAALARP